MGLLRPIRHMVPGLPSQLRFYGSAARSKGFSGPVGSGKTHALCHEALRAACRNPGCPGLIGGPTFPHLHDVTIPTMVGILEQLRMPYRIWGGGRPRIYLPRQEVLIIFRSLENPDRLRGLNLRLVRHRRADLLPGRGLEGPLPTHPASASQEPGRLRSLDTQGF
jgi:hypothetical protein